MGRGRSASSSSWPPAAAALLLVLCFSHCVAAARLLTSGSAAVVVLPQVLHQPAENGAMPAAAVDGGLVVQEGADPGNGDDLSMSEMMGAEEEAVCEEDNKDECLERRLLGDAHLDYIYTQHKGKP